MDPADQIRPDRGMNGPVPPDPAHPGKSGRGNRHKKMAFAALAVPGMAPVAFTVIGHFQPGRLKRRIQSCMYFGGNSHFLLSTPSVWRKKL